MSGLGLVLLTVIGLTQVTKAPLPTEFVNDRVFLKTTAPDSSTLWIYTDSGGGWNSIRTSTANRLPLTAADSIEVDDGKVPAVAFPRFLLDAGIPAPSDEPWLHARLVVESDESLAGVGFMDRPRADLFLGTRWFAERVWELDYPNHNFSVLSGWKPAPDNRSIPLGFKASEDGKRELNSSRPRTTSSDASSPSSRCRAYASEGWTLVPSGSPIARIPPFTSGCRR